MIDTIQQLRVYAQTNPNELTTQQLLNLEKEIKHFNPELITDEFVDFRLWCNKLPSRQERFADFLSKKLPMTSGLKVLEVGCGRTARLSRFLKQKGFNMTCIDPNLDLTYCKDITGICDKFDYRKVDLSEYDYVIVQEPCDATEHVVRACISQHKPFMIVLCGVPHKLIFGKTPKTVYDWYDYLIDISSNKIKLRYIELDPFSKSPLLKSNQF